jgi:hypothetical protein
VREELPHTTTIYKPYSLWVLAVVVFAAVVAAELAVTLIKVYVAPWVAEMILPAAGSVSL